MSKIDDLFKENPVVSYIVVFLIAGIGLYLVASRMFRDPYTLDSQYMYNLQTGELVVVSGSKLAPYELSGGTGVTAWVQSCGDCDDPDAREIAYLEKYSDEAKIIRAKYDNPVPLEEAGPLLAPNAKLVATVEMVEENRWAPYQSPEGIAIASRLGSECSPGGKAKTVCLP